MNQHVPLIAAQNVSCVWVGASAGTGKTKTLTDRVLTLLLEGVPADKILCLTFTKSAATEMYLRVMGRLKAWISLDEKVLIAEIDALGISLNKQQLELARRLFLILLDLEGGLKIMTLHSFCQSLLKRFPLEAGIMPGFTVLDEVDARTLLDKAIDQAYTQRLKENASMKSALMRLNRLYGDGRIRDLLDAFLQERFKLHRNQGQEKALYGMLGLDKGMTEKDLMSDFFNHRPCLLRSIEALEQGTDSDFARALLLKKWQEIEIVTASNYVMYRNFFLTQSGDIKKRLYTKKVAEFYPPIEQDLVKEADRIKIFEDRMECLKAAELSENLMILGHQIHSVYESLKAQRGALDYEDLIIRSCTLLENKNHASWINYKLDGGINHILLDEAQDTNPEQWRIITALMQDFFNGANAHKQHRGLFVVGDRKQSIYRFQRADPELFESHKDFFAQQMKFLNHQILEEELSVSYRSAPAVLKAVDAVFASYNTPHTPHRQSARGIVEVHPILYAKEQQESEPWALPVKQYYEKSLSRQMADQIVRQIKIWFERQEILESKGRPINPGDIMILVRKRGRFMQEMVRALKAAHIPVAGVDRMLLNDELIVKDLIALGEVLLFPEDDLTLAVVLKGPFIGITEEELYNLSIDRPNSLWESLQSKDPNIFETLIQWQNHLKNSCPSDFYNFLLRQERGKMKALSRLSTDAETAIDAFMEQLVIYEKNNIPSLQHFLEWFQSRPIEIKRDLDVIQNEVRIMTVHGAKGLQAPIVFLPDTTQKPYKQPLLLWKDDIPILNRAIPHAQITLLQDKEKEQQTQEYIRLLYVAMTRAEDRLYVHGWSEKQKIHDDSWYSKVHNALLPFAVKIVTERGTILKLEDNKFQPSVVAQHSANVALSTKGIPSWIHKTYSNVKGPVIAFSKVKTSELFEREPTAKRRGQILHKLFEWLPQINSSRRLDFISSYLAKNMPQPYQEELFNSFQKFIATPLASQILDGKGLSEITLTGKVDGHEIIARIDRLIFEGDRILIIDYKTGEKNINNDYLSQLRRYQKLIQTLYFKATINCYLLWIEGASIHMEKIENF